MIWRIFRFHDDDPKGGGNPPEGDPPKTVKVDGQDIPLADLSKDQLVKLAADAVELKRAANAEAKANREKLEALQAQQTEAEKKKKEADMDSQQKLAAREKELAEIKTAREKERLEGRAKIDLLSKGFKADFIEAAIPRDLTEDNYAGKMKEFETKFKDYSNPAGPHPRQLGPGAAPGNDKPKNVAFRALKELKEGGKKK